MATKSGSNFSVKTGSAAAQVYSGATAINYYALGGNDSITIGSSVTGAIVDGGDGDAAALVDQGVDRPAQGFGIRAHRHDVVGVVGHAGGPRPGAAAPGGGRNPAAGGYGRGESRSNEGGTACG